MTNAEKSKRSYLNRDQRKQQLLDTAAAIVDEHGWNGLTMISLAERAQVSRQLVYKHFASIDDLLLQTIDYLFGTLYQDSRQDFSAHPDNLEQAISAQHRHYHEDLSSGRVRALWTILFIPYDKNLPIAKAARLIRRLSAEVPAVAIPKLVGQELPDKQRRQIGFMIDMLFWGSYSLVMDGELNRDEALELLLWMIKRFKSGKRAGPPPATT